MSRRDWWGNEFRRLVVLGESHVRGSGWLGSQAERWPDVLVRLINQCQTRKLRYLNRGISANAISPRSPGYADSAKPSALERYKPDVITAKPDLFILAYGLNDMRAGMHPEDFREDMNTIIRDVQRTCKPLTVLTTVYHMTAWTRWAPYDEGGPRQTRVYNEVIRQLAEQRRCLLADVWAGQGEADWLIHPDGVHANRVGQLVIAHRVFETLAHHCSALSAATRHRDEKLPWTRQCRRAWRRGKR